MGCLGQLGLKVIKGFQDYKVDQESLGPQGYRASQGQMDSENLD